MPLRPSLLVTLAVLLAAPSTAAASVDVRVPADPVAGTTLSFAASASGPEDRIYATLRPYDATPCAEGIDGEPYDRRLFANDATGSTTSADVGAPGTWLICAYSYASRGTPPTATHAIVFVVRAGVAYVALDAPSRAIGPEPFPVAVSGASEVRAEPVVAVKDITEGPCASSVEYGGVVELETLGRITGPFRYAGTHGFVLGLRPGVRRICAWLKDAEGRVIASSSTTIRVQRAIPVLGQIEMNRRRFEAVNSGSTTPSGATGTTVVLRLNTSATVTFRVRRRTNGRWARLPGALSERSRASVDFVRFSGWLRNRQLRRGRYQLLATAHNESGRSATRRMTFWIIGRYSPEPSLP
jgi:hypothetical protein